MGKRDMKNKTPPSGAKSQSLVLRLNTRLFFRQLGIFLCMDLLLVVLALMGQLMWAEKRCADVAQLVQERGVPTAEAVPWMAASDYTIIPLDREPKGVDVGELVVLWRGGNSGRPAHLCAVLLLHRGTAQRRGALRHYGGSVRDRADVEVGGLYPPHGADHLTDRQPVPQCRDYPPHPEAHPGAGGHCRPAQLHDPHVRGSWRPCRQS